MTSDKIYTVYGINGCRAVLQSDFEIISISILGESSTVRNEIIRDLVNRRPKVVQNLQPNTFIKKFGEKRTQGIVVTFTGVIAQPLPSFNKTDGNFCLLIADNITDPQNLGQIIRTAECAGIDGIIIPERNSVGITDAVLQVSQGAFCAIQIYTVTNLNQTLRQLKDDEFWTIAVENGINAKSWNKIDYREKIAIVVGSEGQGIKPLVIKNCDFQATIPMQGKTSSLNVSAAVSAILFERLRQVK